MLHLGDVILWALVAALAALLVLPRISRVRRRRMALVPFDPVPVLRVAVRRKQSRKTTAALSAATGLLR